VEETEEAQCCCQACVRLTDRPAGPRRASLVCVWLSYYVYTCICACVLMQSGTHTHTHTSLPKVDRLPEQYKSAPALVAGVWKLACRDSFQYLTHTHCYIYCPKHNTFYCIQNVKPAHSRILHA